MKKLLAVIVILLAVYAVWNIVSHKSVSGDQATVATSSDDMLAPIKIGSVGPLTGDTSSIGIPSSKAVELAINEVNAAGGINGRKVEFIPEDGKCSTATANNAGAKLISIDKVTAIIGGFCSGETSAFGPNAMQNKVVMISPISSAPALSKLGKYFFRDYPSDTFQGAYAANYMYNNLKVKKVAVVYSNSDWGVGIKDVFIDAFKKLGGQVVIEEGSATDLRDFRTILGKVKAANADYIYTPMYAEASLVFLKQLKEAGMNTKVFGGDAWSDTDFQNKVDGTIGAQYVEIKTGTSDSFTKKFNAAYPDLKIGVGTAQAYDATNILLNALKTVGTDPDKLADAIRATKYDGISGHIEFDQNGDMTEANYIVKKLLGKGKTEEVK